MDENKEIQLIITGDGSHSLLLPGLSETYHSTKGALTESIYVYIQMGLALFPKNTKVSVLEMGFGTGLNALLSLLETEKTGIQIEYHTVEAYPLPQSLWQQLNYGTLLATDHLTSIHQCSWEEKHLLSSMFTFIKYNCKIEEFVYPHKQFNLVYFDAFAPSKQGEVWSEAVLSAIYAHMADEGVLVTYCAQGAFKRTLKHIGFTVEELQGPPGKKEMVRARKTGKG